MVLPLIPIALGLTALGVIGTVVFKFDLDDKIKEMWSGKRITVLGGRGVGKTTFLHYLKTQKIKSSSEQTHIESYQSMTVKVDNISLHIKEGQDVGGSQSQHGEWRKQIQEADILFYLMDISKILAKDKRYIDNVKKDINAIQDKIEKRQDKISIFLIANHADKCDEYTSDFVKFEEKVNKNQTVETAIIEFGGTEHCKVIIGSLKDKDHANKLLEKILKSYQPK